MFLFSSMRQSSSRCPNKMVKDIGLGYTMADIAFRKMRALAATGRFSGWGVAIHEGDELLMAAARECDVPVMPRSKESVTGAPSINVIFECLDNIEDGHVLWLNPSLPMFPARAILHAAEAFNPETMKSATCVRERKNWFWGADGKPINNLDAAQVATQNTPPIYESVHAFHIFDRMRLLRKGLYWEHQKHDPMLRVVDGPEEWFMDVDTQHDFNVLAGYIIVTGLEFGDMLMKVCEV